MPKMWLIGCMLTTSCSQIRHSLWSDFCQCPLSFSSGKKRPSAGKKRSTHHHCGTPPPLSVGCPTPRSQNEKTSCGENHIPRCLFLPCAPAMSEHNGAPTLRGVEYAPETAMNVKSSNTDSRAKTITKVVEGWAFSQTRVLGGNAKGVIKDWWDLILSKEFQVSPFQDVRG